MNKYIFNSMRKYLLLLLAVSLAVVLLSIYGIYHRQPNNYVNICRILVCDEMNNIQKYYDNGRDICIPKQTYDFSIISLDGKVIYTSEDNIKKGDIIDLKTDISFDNYYEVKNKNKIMYSQFLMKEGNKAEAIVRFSIPKNKVTALCKNKFNRSISIIITILLILIFILIYAIFKMIKKDVLNPIEEMHESAKNILRGNYECKVHYDYDGEIGEFSHDFEKMRDSLKESREQEAKLKRNEKELLACISHDLKTPISSISGYCEGIIDGVVKENKDIKRYASIILRKAHILTKLIDDMLDYSKAEINELTIRKEDVYSKDYFYEELEDLSMDVASKNRRFKLIGDIPDMLINIDKKRIQEVLHNLVNNSIKYTKANGLIEVYFEKKNGYLFVHVKDDGIGISEEDIPNVFKKFYRAEKSRNMNIPGSGLGLSISKYIVEHHGGNIEIKSSINKGTEVIFSIKYN